LTQDENYWNLSELQQQLERSMTLLPRAITDLVFSAAGISWKKTFKLKADPKAVEKQKSPISLEYTVSRSVRVS